MKKFYYFQFNYILLHSFVVLSMLIGSMLTPSLGQQMESKYPIAIYEVINATSLNIRKAPTTSSSVVGSLKRHDQVYVYNIDGNWAEIRHGKDKAYIHINYLKKIETLISDKTIDEINEKNSENPVEIEVIEEQEMPKTGTLSNRNSISIGIDFMPLIGVGYCNFINSQIAPIARVGFDVDFAFRFIAKDKIVFIPRNYFIETSLGYTMRGSGAYPLHYISFKINPFGYQYNINNVTLSGKTGLYINTPLSCISTSQYTFSSYVDVGLLIGVQAEYKNYGIGISYQYGFTNVCSSALALHNNCVFLNLSYRLNIK